MNCTSIRKQIVHRADETFPFLHDTMIARLGGRLLLAWYNCTEDEIVGRTVIRGRWSDDDGCTWSEPEIICEDTENGRHMVPVTFSEHNGGIWAYVTEMSAHDRPTGYVCMKYENGTWKCCEKRSDLVLINTLPQLNGQNEWIAGGRMAHQAGELPWVPVVAHASPASPADWQISPLPGPWQENQFPLYYPETALLVQKNIVDAYARNDAGPAWTWRSTDGGHTWSSPQESALPIAPAKMYGGSLPDGRQYLIYNELTEQKDRSKLVLAIRSHADAPFQTACVLADGADDGIDGGPYWHYPCACISNHWLHISCTSSAHSIVRHAALFSLPLEQL